MDAAAMRLALPEPERAVPGETKTDRGRRLWRNRLARMQRDREANLVCSVCGYANINVRHNVDPADQIEGPEYYADMTDLHEFAK
jgi:hypothetical protein